ncbi:MAG: DVU_1553 family AMP-dependent CoA ligase [Thermodesulfobacteriota bacterium]
MKPLRVTPLDAWMKKRLHTTADGPPTRAEIARYQLDRLRETIAYAREKSPFYRDRLAAVPDSGLESLEDLHRLPFTTDEDIRGHHPEMLCVSQGEVARVVTLRTSGTTDQPKRVYFTEEDLELTTDFFHHGLTTLARPGARVMILMPGPAHGSIGDLLVKGLARMDAEGLVYGPVTNPDHAVETLLRFDADGLVGIPSQVLGLTRHPRARQIPEGRIASVLLSADYAPGPVIRGIGSAWGCEVFDYYGLTEMGYGGGVECTAHQGYHLREADLLVEIVDPVTGAPLPEGEPGEVVFTTLTRRAMPLIRYRTGDKARLTTAPCPCGGVTGRLGKVMGRFQEDAVLPGGGVINITRLDEEVFEVSGVLNYRPVLEWTGPKAVLSVEVFTNMAFSEDLARDVVRALTRVPEIRAALDSAGLSLGPVRFSPHDWPTAGAVKRKLVIDRR